MPDRPEAGGDRLPGRREAGGARALAWIYSPPPQRALFGALLDIEREIGASLRAGLDHTTAHARLAWWREECSRTAAGRPTHPLTCEVSARLGAAAAPASLGALTGLVECAEWDLAQATFATRVELSAYCARWSAAMLVPLAQDAGAAKTLGELGTWLRELELLLALAADAHAGRIRWPLDELDALGVSPAQLARPPWPAPLVELLRRRHQQLRSALAGGVAALVPEAQASLRGVIVWLALTAHRSQRATRHLPQVRVTGEDHSAFDGWRAWRTARRAVAGHAALPSH